MHLIIEIEPTPKGVPRFRLVNGRGITYYHPRTTEAMQNIRAMLTEMNLDKFPPLVPLKLEVTFWRTRPKWSLMREKLPCRKPDTTNFVKTIEDCLSPIVVPDDAQYTTIISRKRWCLNGDKGYIEVNITEDKIC